MLNVMAQRFTIVVFICSSMLLGAKIPASAQDGNQIGSNFRVELTNKLGVRAVVNVTSFSAGNTIEGDNEHSDLTQELNYVGGCWPADPDQSNLSNIKFVDSGMVLEADQSFLRKFFIIPWHNIKSIYVKDGVDIIDLNDTSEYRGKIRTILADGSRKYELSAATSIHFIQFINKINDSETESTVAEKIKSSEWKIYGDGVPEFSVLAPQFVYSRFHVTSGGGIYVENGFYETKLSEQFSVMLDAEHSEDSISASLNDFDELTFGGKPKDEFDHDKVTVRAPNAKPVSGTLTDPFGWSDREYLNRNLDMLVMLPDGVKILIMLPSRKNILMLKRVN
jgi:hypothetical protein